MLLLIEMESDKPIYQQIHDQIVEGMATGQLQPGNSLPSIRQLAADFGINLHTVNKAYEILEREGFIDLRRKTGAVVRSMSFPATPSEGWETRQRTLLAEAYARNVTPEDILEHCRRILTEFAQQRRQNSPTLEGGNL